MMDAACVFPVDLTDCSNCRDLCLGPVIFPCGHLICRRCVRQLIVREGLPVHCSSCHQIIPLVQGETISDIIDNMCKDLVIEKMVYERLRQDRTTSCDMCRETKVTHVCLDCRHYLCNTCSSVHSVSERSYGHKQQTLPTTWTTAEIQSQSDSSGLEALCRNTECCQTADETVVDTQTTRSEVEMILYDQICQLKNSKKDVDKLITSLQNVKVRLTIKQQILGLYAAELAKHDQSLVQTKPFLNRVRQIKEDSIPPFPHLAALERCIRALGHCGYNPSERPNTPQVNGDEGREVIIVEQMVEINIKESESGKQVTSQTAEQSPSTLKGVDCIKIAGRSTAVKIHSGTVRVETITDPKVLKVAENIVVAKIDWSNDRIQKLETERREMKAFEEKNKEKMVRLEKDIAKVTRQLEDERERWTQRIEEERSRATEQVGEKEIKLRKLEVEKNRAIKQLKGERSILEEERSKLTSQLEEERKRREEELKVMKEKHKEKMKKERKNVVRFVMRLEGRDRLLSDVLGRVEDGHLSQVLHQLLHDFHIQLLGVDCGLNFLMEVPASRWGEVVQEQLQGVLSDLIPETDRQEVTWSSVMQLDRSQDMDLRLGQPLQTPETVITRTSIDGQGQAHQRSAENYWLKCIHKWYPHLHSKTYFLPPFHFNRVPYCVENIAGNQVLVLQNPQSVSAGRRNHGNLTFPSLSDSEVRDDRALQRVLHGMRSLAVNGQQKEVMFVVSQLQFDNYLGEPRFAPTAALLPRPSTLPEHFREQHYDKGDFDVLIIHKQHGLFILEINSVGENFGLGKMTEEQEDSMLKKTVEVVTKQLNKAEVVLRHLTSDLNPKINITKSLVTPYIKSSQLKQAIKRYPSAGQVLCQCFGVQRVVDAAKLCLLSDQLSEKQMSSKINESFIQALRKWWQHVVRASGKESLMTSSLYEQLLARFCGPATTVEVHSVTAPRLNIRTMGEAVSETGERVSKLMLLPQQVDILNRSPPRTLLSGPPGTGKTIVLIMQGLTWLQNGHDVHVVSTWYGSRAATIVIEHQLQETVRTSTVRSHVHRHQFDIWIDEEVETAIRRLKSLSEGRQLCVIVDEVVRYYRKPFTKFCDQLFVQVPGVFIWGASLYHDVRPLCLEEVKLTTPLRSPPVVVREVMMSKEIKNEEVHDYTISDVPVPTDGPPILRIKHHEGRSGHPWGWPLDCVNCGHQVARVLTELDVGRTGDSNGPPPLQYRDVLVLCYDYPTDDRVKGFGLKTKTTSGLVRGLRDRHVPVRVVEKGDETAILDTALGVGDLVTVANWRDVQGLERKVVVVEKIGFFRLLAMSRCTSQLVVIHSLRPA